MLQPTITGNSTASTNTASSVSTAGLVDSVTCRHVSERVAAASAAESNPIQTSAVRSYQPASTSGIASIGQREYHPGQQPDEPGDYFPERRIGRTVANGAAATASRPGGASSSPPRTSWWAIEFNEPVPDLQRYRFSDPGFKHIRVDHGRRLHESGSEHIQLEHVHQEISKVQESPCFARHGFDGSWITLGLDPAGAKRRSIDSTIPTSNAHG